MSDHVEEQEMEAEALTAIFDTAFEVTKSDQPFEWSVSLYPIDTHDEVERDEVNHVACKLKVEVPSDYPDALPVMDVEILKGLSEEHREKILTIANEEAEAYMGMPAVYAVCEAIRTWLGDNNVKGLDDISMHAQMMRKQAEAEQSKIQAQQKFEAQKVTEELTQAEKEELEVRKRRAEGTPCNKENFEAWKAKFEAEMAEKAIEEENARTMKDRSNIKKKNKSNTTTLEDEMEDRLTGYEQFTQKKGLMSLELLEKAAEEAAAASGDESEGDDSDGLDVDNLDVDKDLFDDDDDLDDLDFEDDSFI